MSLYVNNCAKLNKVSLLGSDCTIWGLYLVYVDLFVGVLVGLILPVKGFFKGDISD